MEYGLTYVINQLGLALAQANERIAQLEAELKKNDASSGEKK